MTWAEFHYILVSGAKKGMWENENNLSALPQNRNQIIVIMHFNFDCSETLFNIGNNIMQSIPYNEVTWRWKVIILWWSQWTREPLQYSYLCLIMTAKNEHRVGKLSSLPILVLRYGQVLWIANVCHLCWTTRCLFTVSRASLNGNKKNL